jgi:hypothetical protein
MAMTLHGLPRVWFLTAAAVMAMAGGLPGVARAAATPAARSVHSVSIDIRGPVALVTVERSLAPVIAAGEPTLELDLPDGAAALGWEVVDDGPRVRLGETSDDKARASHRHTALERGARVPTPAKADDGTDFRVHLAARERDTRARLRYRYSVPLTCRAGRFVLHLPGSLEADPLAPEVSLSIAGAAAGNRITDVELAGVPVAGRGQAGGARLRATGQAPARAAWEVSFALRADRPRFPAQVLAAVSRAGAERDPSVAVSVCRGAAAPPASPPAPERVLLLIDRSRSVGPAGSVAERDLARAVIEVLPPSIRFNAIFFDRAAAPLFPVARTATNEALGALENELGPGQLKNGTDLPRALKVAADLVRADADGPTVRTWLVVITDGALPEGQRASALLEATTGLAPAYTDALVLLVRPRADDPPADSAVAVLRALPARFGGVLRTVDPAELRSAASVLVAAARQGGDLFALGLGEGGGVAAAAANGSGEGFGHLAPGEGQVRILGGGAGRAGAGGGNGGGGRLVLAGRLAGEAVTAPLRPAQLEAGWLTPHTGRGTPASAWIGASRRIAFWIERGPGSAPPPPDQVVRGEMDRTVVRNALSLAFLPRARACYLTRRVRGAADLELRGRLRLELHLQRGEMLDAQVRGSTLKRPDIEGCLRDAAFGIEVPRPLHRDAPTVAVLNLQFQPTTPPPGSNPDSSALSKEIDLLIGPISFPTDPRELLETPLRRDP